MISINLEKARNIAHSVRRKMRDDEMKPFDDIIAKQIPGNSFQQIESQREVIRKKYEAVQRKIDSANSAQELENILKQL